MNEKQSKAFIRRVQQLDNEQLAHLMAFCCMLIINPAMRKQLP